MTKARTNTSRGLALLVAGVLLAGCTGGASDDDKADDPKPSPTPTASKKDYEKALASVAGSLNGGLRELSADSDLDALSGKITQNQNLSEKLAGWVREHPDPPKDDTSLNNQLAATLDGLNSDFGRTSKNITENKVCTSSAALADLGTSPTLRDLPALSQDFSRRGYTFQVSVPSFPAKTTSRPSNGTFVKKGDRSGRGQMTIENKTDSDTLITFSLKGKASYSVYVRSGKKHVVKGIKDGKYRLYYNVGEGWDTKEKAFARECAASQLESASEFKTTSTTYSANSLKLTESARPSGKSSGISPDDVPK